MSTLTLFFVVVSMVAFSLGVKVFKISNVRGETTIYGRDLLAFGLIALGLTGSFISLGQFQAETPGLGGGAGCSSITLAGPTCGLPAGDCTSLNLGTAPCVPPTNDLQNFTAGTASFSTTAGTLFYTQSVTFSPALRGSPCAGCLLLSVVGNGPLVSIPGPSFVFLADGGSTQTDGVWANMPAATTELFAPSTTSHLCCRIAATVTGITSCVLSVDIIVYSNTVGATLAVQYSTSQTQAGPWATITGSSVDINAIAALPKLSNNFTPTTGHQGVDLFRIVGSGGGGAGDNPQFGNISMACEFTLGGIAHPSWSAATATGFTLFLQMTVPDPNVGDTIIIGYSAYVCTSGFSTPC